MYCDTLAQVVAAENTRTRQITKLAARAQNLRPREGLTAFATDSGLAIRALRPRRTSAPTLSIATAILNRCACLHAYTLTCLQPTYAYSLRLCAQV